MNSTTYGIGGYNPDHQNGNIVEQTVDNGDGTGTRTDYTTDPPTVTQLTGLPISPLPDDLLLTAVDPRDTTTIRRT